jgi:hypothetical protein
VSDPALERLEDELRESRFKPWDVETFLANRHQAKIDALTAPGNKWRQRRQVAQELATGTLAFIGYITVMTIAGVWLVSGAFPLG